MHSLNRTSAVCAGLALLLCAPIVSGAVPSKRDAYRDASLKAFYFFGEEEFESFSCDLKVDVLAMLIKGLEEEFKAAKLPLVLTENTDTFQVTFSKKTDETTFVAPSLSVTVKPGAKVPDSKQLEAGIQQIEAGYKSAVIGAVQIVRGAFDEYRLSRFTKYADVAFTPTERGYDAAFSKDGARVSESFDGTVRRMMFQVGAQSITSKSTHISEGDKGLVVSEAELIPDSGTRIAIALEYQTVKAVLIPRALRVHTRQEVQGKLAENRVTVTLERCKVRR
jgi:hypothetical protein